MNAPAVSDCAIAPASSPSRGGPEYLRRLVERRDVGKAPAAPLPFGLAPLDAALGGGLATGALHEIAGADETRIAAATGFALALAARRLDRDAIGSNRSNGMNVIDSNNLERDYCEKPVSTFSHPALGGVVWIAETLSQGESGAAYGPGLEEIGLAPERLVTVATAHTRETLWAMEEALRCRAVGAVIGETRARDIDLVATRRLSLAAQHRGGLALLLRIAPTPEASAAATRWIVGGEAGGFFEGGPRWRLRLVRNRRGFPGSWIVEWNRADQRFEFAHSGRMAEPAVDRPHQARA